MSRRSELVCDGCARAVEWPAGARGRPAGWRRLVVTDGAAVSHTFDVCSAYCASKAVDTTYAEDDKLDAVRAGLRLVSSDSAH